jgi:anti-sigma-K factor RskA
MSGPNDSDEDSGDDRVMAAEYALGLMDERQARAFEARLAAEPGLRAAYAGWAEDLATLAEAEAPQVAPPAHVRAGIDAALFAPPRGRWPGLLRRIGLGAALAAAAVAMLVVFGPFQTTGGRPDMVAELSSDGGALRVTAGYRGADQVLEITRVAGAPAPGRSFELWLIAGEDVISLGVLPETGRGLIVVPPLLGERIAGAQLAISDEPEGGSPTGQATGPILAVAPMVAITSS